MSDVGSKRSRAENDDDDTSSSSSSSFHGGDEDVGRTAIDEPREKLLAFWKKKKAEKKARRRERNELKRANRRAEWEQLSPEEQEAKRQLHAKQHDERRQALEAEHQQRLQRLADPTLPQLGFDFTFEAQMSADKVRGTVSQVKMSHALCVRHGMRLRPVFLFPRSSQTEKEAAESEAQPSAVEKALSDFIGFKKYPPEVVHVGPERYDGLPEKSTSSAGSTKMRVVYLTADSPNVLRTIEPSTCYVIGAIIDHNAKKGLTFQFAQQHGLQTARFPLDEHISILNRCKILTINHVTAILARVAVNGDWKEAFEAELPLRREKKKGGLLDKGPKVATEGEAENENA